MNNFPISIVIGNNGLLFKKNAESQRKTSHCNYEIKEIIRLIAINNPYDS